MPGTGPVLQAPQESGQGQHGEVPAHTLQLLPGPERPSYAGAAVEVLAGLDGRLSLRHDRAHHPCPGGSRRQSGISPERPRPFRHCSCPCPPAPTAWANVGPRLSNNWTQGPGTRGIQGPSPAARPQPASPKPPLRASRRSFRGRDGRRFRKPSARACPFGQLSGNWESTGPPSRSTCTPRVLQRRQPRVGPATSSSDTMAA